MSRRYETEAGDERKKWETDDTAGMQLQLHTRIMRPC